MRSLLRATLFHIICFAFLFMVAPLSGQGPEMSGLSASKLLSMGQNAERMSDVYSAVRYYDAYLEARPKKTKVRWKLAAYQEQIRDYGAALSNYEQIATENPKGFPLVKFEMAGIQMRLGEYEKARVLYDEFIKDYREESDYSDYRRIVKAKIAGCDTSMMFRDAPLKVVIEKMDEGVNNPHADASPIVYGDKLIYSSLKQEKLEMMRCII